MWRQQKTGQILRTGPVRINLFNTDNDKKARFTFNVINSVTMRNYHTSATASKKNSLSTGGLPILKKLQTIRNTFLKTSKHILE
jgi:hypothetical protein